MSLALLMLCYASFGWYLSGIQSHPSWMQPACDRMMEALVPTTSHPSELNPGKSAESEGAKVAPAIRSKTSTPEPNAAKSTPEERPDPAEREIRAVEPSSQRSHHICHIVVQHNLPTGLLAVGWILISSLAFISPLSSFSAFVSRWFSSDTVAFLTIFMIAGMAAVVLFWLHVFLQILTILAVDALARIDIQAAGLSGLQAFWLLTLVALLGLAGGWLANGVL